MACDVVVAGRLPAAQSTGAFGDGATESLSKTMIRYSRKVEGAEVSAVYSSKWIAGLAGRWDRNRTCNLRFWSTRRSVQIRPGTSNIALNSLISATHRPAASKHVQPLCSQFCSQRNVHPSTGEGHFPYRNAQCRLDTSKQSTTSISCGRTFWEQVTSTCAERKLGDIPHFMTDDGVIMGRDARPKVPRESHVDWGLPCSLAHIRGDDGDGSSQRQVWRHEWRDGNEH
jgi:hypothetical protein